MGNVGGVKPNKKISQPIYDIVSGEKYTDKKSNDEKMSFTRVGACWSRKDKDGFYIKLKLQNQSGEYFLLPRKGKSDLNEKTPF